MSKSRRLRSMMQVDFRRLFTTSRLPIFLLIALMMPVLILTMTTMVGGTEVTNPQTGAVTTMEAFTNTWQVIGTESGTDMMAMDMTTMVNINLIFFMAGVFVCLFVADDFRSGYAKNLFTVRSHKMDYVISKTVSGCIAGALMLLAFFIGAVIGGGAAGLPFTLGAAGVIGLVMCMMAKILLMPVFVPIAVAVSVFGKSRSWLSILLFAFAGMLLFMMIPMLTPLDAGIMNVGLCLAGGVMFGIGLCKVSEMLLRRQDLV
ncbi:MAG: ABC transporter permease [Clostridia bacterium]|nr:ABC transporter permease [Clostridia bacterium]